MYVAQDLLVLRKSDAIYSYAHNVDLFVRNRFLSRHELRPVDIDRAIYQYLTADDISRGQLRRLLFPKVDSLTPLQAFSYEYELPDQYYELLGAINEV